MTVLALQGFAPCQGPARPPTAPSRAGWRLAVGWQVAYGRAGGPSNIRSQTPAPFGAPGSRRSPKGGGHGRGSRWCSAGASRELILWPRRRIEGRRLVFFEIAQGDFAGICQSLPVRRQRPPWTVSTSPFSLLDLCGIPQDHHDIQKDGWRLATRLVPDGPDARLFS